MEHTERMIESEEIFRGKIIRVRRDTVELPNGKTAGREIVEHNGGVCILALDEEDCTYLVRQYRYAFAQELTELPAGKLEPGEDPAACALRELEEETGYRSEDLELLINVNTTVAFCNEFIGIYVAKNLITSRQHLDEDEYMNVEAWELNDLIDMILRQEITDSKTMAALMAYKIKYGK